LAALFCGAPSAQARHDVYGADAAHNWLLGFSASSTGLGLLSGFPIGATSDPTAVVVSKDGAHLYATVSATDSVLSYGIGANGTVAALATTAAGDAPSAAAMAPDGLHLFVGNAGSNAISRYAVGLNGSLSSVGVDTPVGDGTAPAALAMSPNGAWLYVVNGGNDTISTFIAGSDGSLTASGNPVPAGPQVKAVAASPDGHHLYTVNAGDGTVTIWSVGADGSLSAAGEPVSAASGASGVTISPDGTRLLVANSVAGSISRFLIAADGSLVSAGTDTTTQLGAESIVFSTDGRHVFVGGLTGIAEYDVSLLGALTTVGSPTVTNGNLKPLTVAPNQGPQAKMSLEAQPAGSESAISGMPSTDDDGAVADWAWDFGDGTTGSGEIVRHVYQSPGDYLVTLTVSDDEGCSTTDVYTGQFTSCAGRGYAVRSQMIHIDPPPDITPGDPPCIHDGDDGFCDTPDLKAPRVQILGVSDKASINTVDAPEEIVGVVTPDPSGIKEIRLRFAKAGGTITKRTVKTRRVCRKVKGKRKCRRKPVYKKTCKKVKGKRRCHRKKVVKDTKVSACLTISGTKNYLVKYDCSKVPWITVGGDTTFRYSLPVALGTGSYTVEVLATDGAGNSDLLERGRNDLVFQIVNTPSNSGDGTGVGTGTGGGTTTPVDDTGSPFGHS
jgi:6-phosphogluconolactonase (cycloisomerase 2 family)